MIETTDLKKLIAVTGGIGSGKSVVCHILRVMGFPVYDCDSRARELMDNDATIKSRISREISTEAITADGRIDRPRLSSVVFNDSAALNRLNKIVHGAVKDDLKKWENSHNPGIAFVETAILYQSGLDRIVHEVWEVTAPAELRIERVKSRSGLTREQITARISAQDSFVPDLIHPQTFIIFNDGCEPLLLQIENQLDNIIAADS